MNDNSTTAPPLDDTRQEALSISANHPQPPIQQASELIRDVHGHAVNALWDFWSGEVRAAVGDVVGATVAVGRAVLAAKAHIGHGNLDGLLGHPDFPLDDRAAQMFLRIARHPILSDETNYADLPHGLVGLYMLSGLDANVVEEGLRTGEIHSAMTLKDTKALCEAHRTQRDTPNASPESSV